MNGSILIAIMAAVVFLSVTGAMAERDSVKLAEKKPVTECRPPSDSSEKLVAWVYSSADGNPGKLHCEYHSTMAFAP